MNLYQDSGFWKDQRGGVIVMVVLFLPVAILSLGMVARKIVQSACDLGALAGCQELDWELLAIGELVLSEERGRAAAIEMAFNNLRDLRNGIKDVTLNAQVSNDAGQGPRLFLEAEFKIQTVFIRYLPGCGDGFPCSVISEAAVLERQQW